MHFFPQRRALIVWNDNNGLITEFLVVDIEPGSFESPEVRRLRSSWGNCIEGWENLNEVDATLQIIKIFLTHEFENQDFRVYCLVQCAQIYELKLFRRMVWNLESLYDNFTDFLERYFGEPIQWDKEIKKCYLDSGIEFYSPE